MKRIYNTILAILFLANISISQTPLTTAVDFDVVTVHGDSINLFSLLDEGKHVLVDFFFTTCAPCILSIPTVNTAFEKYGCNTGEIVFISIDQGDSDAQVLEYETDYGGLLPSASGIEGGGNAVVEAYGIFGFPTIILIAPDRSIVRQGIGEVTQANLDAAINTDAGIEPNPTTCSATTAVTDLEKPNANITSTYPNPTSSLTIVEFAIPNSTSVAIEVFNMAGQKVVSIPSKSYSTGNHTIEISAENLSDGSYIINLIDSDGAVSVSKFTVLK